jgi:GNAT superfamily N-acetyltransferase
MVEPLSLADIHADPARVTSRLQLPTGQPLAFRPLAADDAALLGRYFLGLSEETRRRFGPHALDQAAADQLCAEHDRPDTLRMIAAIDAPQPELIAYLILLCGVTEHDARRYQARGRPLDPLTTCTVAPSVADAWQGQRLGPQLLGALIDVARRLGFRTIVLMGGVQASNSRAVRLYQRLGFQQIATFEYPDNVLNYDMLLELQSA